MTGMNSVDALAIINQIAETSARTGKEELVDRWIKDPLFKQVLVAAYDTFTTYGVTPPKVKEFGLMCFDMKSVEPWAMLRRLASRELTGNAAKAEVKQILEDMDEPSSQLLYRILSKDLRAGFGKNTVNRVLPGTIVTFDVMLSKPYEAKRIKAWPVAVEPKLDGLRAMSLCHEGMSKAFSRVGNHFPALDHLGPHVVAMVQEAWNLSKARAEHIEKDQRCPLHGLYHRMLGGEAGPSLGIDAEAITGGFNKTSGDVKRKSVSADDAVLHVFDCVPYALLTGDESIIKIPYKVRRAFVEFVVSCAKPAAPIVHTPMELCHSDDAVMAVYQKHRDAGLEGAMVKPLDSRYVKKKTHNWMKLKNESTEDLRIVGWFEGEVGTRLEGVFAGYLVEREHKGEIVTVAIGGGYKHAELQSFGLLALGVPSHPPIIVRGQTRHTFTAPGRLIEVEFHEITVDGSLRHPRFVRWRDDKDEFLKVAA